MKTICINCLVIIGLLLLLIQPATLLPGKEKKRLVTVAPALTEIVFALGEGERIVGNTKFCNYPEEAKKILRIGGLLDVNLEVLVAARPDIIFLYPENYEKIKIMEKKAQMVKVSHTNLKDLFAAIAVIAKSLEVEERGTRLLTSIKVELDGTRQKAAGKKKPKTLLIIGRNRNQLTNMFIIGKKDFLNELIEIAGGVNAYRGDINYPSISMESVIAMNPDVIIELSAFNEGIEEEQVFTLWKKYSFISAVRNRKITVIKNSVWLIPGPRVAQIAKKMQQIFFD